MTDIADDHCSFSHTSLLTLRISPKLALGVTASQLKLVNNLEPHCVFFLCFAYVYAYIWCTCMYACSHMWTHMSV